MNYVGGQIILVPLKGFTVAIASSTQQSSYHSHLKAILQHSYLSCRTAGFIY